MVGHTVQNAKLVIYKQKLKKRNQEDKKDMYVKTTLNFIVVSEMIVKEQEYTTDLIFSFVIYNLNIT